MNSSFLSSVIKRYYPSTAEKIQTLIESNALLEKLAVNVYSKLEASVQKYADIADRVKVLTRMVNAWKNKNYNDISGSSIFISIVILLYIVNPIDLLPDFIPIIGGLDDILLLGYLLKIIDKEIERFIKWENSTEHNNL